MTIAQKSRGLRAAAATIAVAAVALLAAPTPVLAADEVATAAAQPVVRRLSPDQYRQVISDIFGPTIKIGGRFEPDMREGGLLAVGASRISVTGTGLEQYFGMARTVAQQVVNEPYRGTLLSCTPANAAAPDDACASKFLSKVGRLLYRRPLTQQELQKQVSVAAAGATSLKSFYIGLETSLADMLVSPKFLFRAENAEPDPEHKGQYRMDAYTKASQLSFLFWNAAPDPALLAAAETGELNTKKGLAKQIDRLLASPRIEGGVRAFFVDMLGFDQFETLSKDTTLYPKFNPQVTSDSREQALRTIVDLLLTNHGDYRDLFTTRKTFLTPSLGTIYNVPVVRDVPNGAPDEWLPHEYAEGDPRAGILAQASFVALHSHPGRSSPTLRGKALREIMLCQKVPDPPGNVDFTLVQDTGNTVHKTARDRVTAHRANAVCAGCHKLIDPMGLALENFDGSGAFRRMENGVAIDSSGELDGVQFKDAVGLGKAMHDNPAATSCLVNRVAAYALGRVPMKGESAWVKSLESGFATNGYRFPDLLKQIATSDEFYRVAAPQVGALDVPSSKLANTDSLQGVAK